MEQRRVVITGMGPITPIGTRTDNYWRALVDGVSGTGPITRFDASEYSTRIAAEVKDFDPEQYVERKEARRMDRFVQFAIAASKLAVEDSGLEIRDNNADRVGVLIGSGIGGTGTWEEQHRILLEKGSNRVSPFFVPMLISDMGSGMVSILLGAKGPNMTIVTACATATHAIGEAFEIIKRGDADVMIAGGSEAAVTPLAVAGFCSMRALSTRNEEPGRASRPFDLNRDGFVIGEGAGTVIVEALDHALGQGVRPFALRSSAMAQAGTLTILPHRPLRARAPQDPWRQPFRMPELALRTWTISTPTARPPMRMTSSRLRP